MSPGKTETGCAQRKKREILVRKNRISGESPKVKFRSGEFPLTFFFYVFDHAGQYIFFYPYTGSLYYTMEYRILNTNGLVPGSLSLCGLGPSNPGGLSEGHEAQILNPVLSTGAYQGVMPRQGIPGYPISGIGMSAGPEALNETPPFPQMFSKARCQHKGHLGT